MFLVLPFKKYPPRMDIRWFYTKIILSIFGNKYILPGYNFQVVQGMITNFHLPKSTLIMMISAFVGRRRLLSTYELAKVEGYRFYSFGDAMLII